MVGGSALSGIGLLDDEEASKQGLVKSNIHVSGDKAILLLAPTDLKLMVRDQSMHSSAPKEQPAAAKLLQQEDIVVPSARGDILADSQVNVRMFKYD